MLSARRPGQPLAMLVLLVSVWTMGRAIAWEPPFPGRVGTGSAKSLVLHPTAGQALPRTDAAASSRRPGDRRVAATHPPLPLASESGLARPEAFPSSPSVLSAPIRAAFVTTPPALGDSGADATIPRRGAASRQIPAQVGTIRRHLPRWSADGWLLLRPGSPAAIAAAPIAGRYGASQTGAVVRYRLGSGARAPALYGRASAALKSPRERELALGLTARPVRGLPVAAQAEARLTRSAGRTSVGPAVMAVSQLDPIALPFEARAEVYLAGGYVGGVADTPFVDGHLRLDRDVLRVGSASLRLGGGAWGGAQDGAAALDIGPAAVLALDLGEVRTHIELDYRLRVAGDSAPRSGPALTLSTGF